MIQGGHCCVFLPLPLESNDEFCWHKHVWGNSTLQFPNISLMTKILRKYCPKNKFRPKAEN